jgi:hypothetical protein
LITKKFVNSNKKLRAAISAEFFVAKRYISSKNLPKTRRSLSCGENPSLAARKNKTSPRHREKNDFGLGAVQFIRIR